MDVIPILELLLVEDNPQDVKLIKELINDAKTVRINLHTADSTATLQTLLEKTKIDVVLLDLHLLDSQGISTAQTVCNRYPHLPIVIITSINDESLSYAAIQCGAQDYLVKGLFDTEHLVRTIRMAIERHHLRRALKTAYLQQEFLATHDSLTGIPNRHLFYDRLTQLLSTATRYQFNFGVIFIDLDHFKTINDTYGHTCGDHLLRQAATRLKQTLRESDTVARMGGDEFIILLSRIKSPETITLVTDKLLKVLKQPYSVEQETLHITASIGGAIYPQHGLNADALITHADKAMYRAKQQGGDCFFLSE